MKRTTLLVAATMLSACLTAAWAAPVQYEMDLRTQAGMGAGGAMGMMGAMFGRQGANVSKSMDLRLTNPADIPDGYKAEHTVPDAMRIGPKLPLKGERRTRGSGGTEGRNEEPDGRLLIYWGCSEKVGKGQPQVVDFKAMAQSLPPEMQGMVRQMQARRGGGTAVREGESLPPRMLWWPGGDTNIKGIPADASAVGEHVVKASFMNEDIRYTLDAGLDFLEPLNLKANSDDLKAAIPLSWDGLKRVKGYNLQAVGGAEKEMVIWMAERSKSPMLPASQTQCTIPAGIFEKAQFAMVNEEGVGPTGGFAFPPQEKDKPKKPLIWSVRVRVNTGDSAMLGMGQASGRAAGKAARESAREEVQQSTEESAADAAVPGGGAVLKGLKGLFGR